jgi:putative ATPase
MPQGYRVGGRIQTRHGEWAHATLAAMTGSNQMAGQGSLFGPGGGSGRPDRSQQPLAARMRPRSLDQVVGQEHILAPGRGLRTALEADRVPSMILWGPPGVGKTTLAAVIARVTRAHFVALSAVSAGVSDLRRVVQEARDWLRVEGKRTILFVDEIHRFNKAQQDAILPHVENGTVTLIGATTENPSFEVNAALLSRTRVFTLHALTDEHVETLILRALADAEHGLGSKRIEVMPEALRHLVRSASGDARTALNGLELAVQGAGAEGTAAHEVPVLVTLAHVEDALQRKALLYDPGGEQHYDTVSAFIKSIRGSDADAAVYWLARMIEAGEDVKFVARRLVILASEDVGLADPQALAIAVAAQQAAHFVGLPEASYPLTEATLYLATAPKSNSVKRAYFAAAEAVMATRNDPVPLHLRNAATGLTRNLGYGEGYKYSHAYQEDDPDRWLQHYLPENVQGRTFYEPGEQGFEAEEVAARLRRIAEMRKDRIERTESTHEFE